MTATDREEKGDRDPVTGSVVFVTLVRGATEEFLGQEVVRILL